MRKPAKEYGQELVGGYWRICDCTIAGAHTMFRDIAKQCALKCLEELKNAIPWEDHQESGELYTYYEEVKKEVEGL